MLKVFLSSVLLVLLAVLAQAQVVGVAEDEFGPVAGVEIHVNGAHLGYYSEADGSFTIDAGLGDTLLFVHPMTLAEKSILVSAHNLGVVRIEDAAVVLQEVVTMGYGIRESYDERNSSYAKIGGDRLRSTPTSSIDQALQGNVAGLQVGQSSGVPGARTPIFLRGITSISGVSDPLFVINGVPVLTGDNTSLANNANALSALDPNEIEDVTVLKDALATSLYGARGANGVVLITLKKGSRSRQDLSFSSELGFGSAAYNKMRPMNSEQFLHYTSHALFNTGQFSSLQDAIDFRSQSWDGVTDTDWTKLLERSTATTQRYNFAYSGGSDQITFSSNLSYLDQKGLYDNIYFRRLSFGLGSEWKANDRLSLTANISLSTTNQRNPLEGLAANNPIFSGLYRSPFLSPYNADGSYNVQLNGLGPNVNIVATNALDRANTAGYRIFAIAGLNYEILPSLRFTSNAGVEFNYYDEYRFNNPDFGDGHLPTSPNGNGLATATARNITNSSWSNALNFNKVFASNHDLAATVAFETIEIKRNNQSASSQGFASGFPDLYTLQNGANPTGASSSFSNTGYASFVARAHYSYDRRYAITVNARRDGSSRFGKDSRFGDFWGIGGSWNLHNEEFLANAHQISNLKLRASYGQVGNAEINDYAWQALYAPRVGTYLNSPAGAITNPGNSELQWERTNQYNVGVDFGLFRSRVSGSIDYYKKYTTDLLFNQAIPFSSSGFGSLLTNIGSTESQGVELELTGLVARTSGFAWTVLANFSFNDSKVTQLADGRDEYIIGGNKNLKVEHNPSEYYLRLWAGVDPANGNALWYTDASRTQTTSNVNEASFEMTGKYGLPRYNAGVTNQFNFGDLSLSFLVTYAGGFSVYDNTAWVLNSDARFGDFNQTTAALDFWTPENTQASNPRPIWGNATNSNATSTRYLRDGDFIRLRNAEIGYNLSPKILGSNSAISGIFVYVKGSNLLTWVKDKSLQFDPEAAGAWNLSSLEGAGIYNATFPNLREILIGTKINF